MPALPGATETTNAAALFILVLTELCSTRPHLVVPPASLQGLAAAPETWSADLLRGVHNDLTHALRGVVEDLGYDPDMLPQPAPLPRLVDVDTAGLIVFLPDPTPEELAAMKLVPGQTWDAALRVFRVPLLPPVIAALRDVVRAHRVAVSPEATNQLRALAERIRLDPSEAAVAVVSVQSDKRVLIRFRVASPSIADAFKRVPSLRWDAAAGGFTAPATRLREVLAVAKTQPATVDPSAVAANANAEAPLLYDGTLDGLRGVPVGDLNSVSGKKLERFEEFGIRTVLDLLLLTPRRYLDRSNLTPISALVEGQEVGLVARVLAIESDQQKRMVRITLGDATGKIKAIYFNAIWQARRFRVGDEVSVHGKVDSWTGGGRSTLSLANPIMDPIGDETLSVIPIYPQSAKTRVTTWEIQSAVAEALRRLGELADPLPGSLLDRLELTGRQAALKAIHLPTSVDSADAARTRLAFDELFRMQAALLMMKAAEETEAGITHAPTGGLTGALFAGLPFGLTGAQSRALTEIEHSLRAPYPMHRLLQGDVGSGKTVVASTALLQAVESGYQGALMAPTEILASQLYAEIVERTAGMVTADGTPLAVEFFSNKLRGKKRDAALARLADGSTNIAVGTHALIVGDISFNRLGLAVVDEQHRFGVQQRAALREKGPVSPVDGSPIRPDMLVMTATPIPRTAAMTVFGDLDVSVLDELPPGRTPIVTTWIDAAPDLTHSTANPWDLVRAEVALGHQAYVVCPLVEESEKMQAASAVDTFEQLQWGALAGLRLGLVHGQQRPDERTETMNAFRAGELDVLVATTVIEVGVNVPNATAIVILDSARFGIAQLHQLRGRVGRGSFASSCVLVGRCVSSDARARMEALVASTDGFWLSEVDLGLRGHGQVFGAAQSGASDLRVADLDRDRDLLVIARTEALGVLEGDPGLRRRPGLRAEIAAVLGADAQDWLAKS